MEHFACTKPLHVDTHDTHLCLSNQPFSDLAGRNITFISGSAADNCTLRLADVDLDWQNPSEFGDVAGFIRQMIKQRLVEAAARPKSGQTVQIALNLLLTSTISLHSRIHTEVARHVTFTDMLQGLAFKAITRLRAETGMPAFNGVHLRIEDDFSHVKDTGKCCLFQWSTAANVSNMVSTACLQHRSPGVVAHLHRRV